MFRGTSRLKRQIEDLTCEKNNAWNRVRELESQLQDSRKLREELKEQLSISKSLVKGLQQQIRVLTETNTALKNVANSRLSALTGMKRYLDSFFETPKKTKTPQ